MSKKIDVNRAILQSFYNDVDTAYKLISNYRIGNGTDDDFTGYNLDLVQDSTLNNLLLLKSLLNRELEKGD